MAVVRESSGVAALDRALAEIVERVAELADADLVVARLVDEPGTGLIARAVHAPSASLRAELEGSRIGPDAVLSEERDEPTELPRPLVLAAEQLAPAAVLQLPVRDGSAVVGSLELMRRRGAFDGRQRLLARAAAAEIALARRAYGDGDGTQVSAPDLLALAGDALAAGSDESRAADQVAALAAEATGAVACLVWRYAADEPLLAALSGSGATAVPPVALDAVRQAQATGSPLTLERLVEELPGSGVSLATLQLGQPPLGALQLVFADEDPGEELLARLGTFAVRAAHALRASERRQTLAVELERTRALLTIVGQAISELSLAHTLETAVERVCELLGTDRLAVYLVEEDGERLEPAAARGLTGPHVRVGERLLELVLGPSRGRGLLLVPDAAADPRLTGVREALEEVGIEAALAVPLRVREELIGLLAVYPDRGRPLTENEESLMLALAAAALRMPDPRGDELIPVAVHVREERLAEPIRQILSLPQSLSPVRPSVFRGGEPLVLDPAAAVALGSAHEPLIPFLEKGSSATARSPARRSRPRPRSRARPRSLSTTRASTSSRRTSRTRCSARSCRGRARSSKSWRSATSTTPLLGWTSAATSTTSSSSRTAASRSSWAT